MRLDPDETTTLTVTPGQPIDARRQRDGIDTADTRHWPTATGPADADRAARAYHLVRISDWQAREGWPPEPCLYVAVFRADLDAIEAAQREHAAHLADARRATTSPLVNA